MGCADLHFMACSRKKMQWLVISWSYGHVINKTWKTESHTTIPCLWFSQISITLICSFNCTLIPKYWSTWVWISEPGLQVHEKLCVGTVNISTVSLFGAIKCKYISSLQIAFIIAKTKYIHFSYRMPVWTHFFVMYTFCRPSTYMTMYMT